LLAVIYDASASMMKAGPPDNSCPPCPSAGVGALLALMLFGYDLSLVFVLGIILLMGIVKKNAIMMIILLSKLSGQRISALKKRFTRHASSDFARL